MRRAALFLLVTSSSCAGIVGIEEVTYRNAVEDGGPDADAAVEIPAPPADRDASDAAGPDAGVRPTVVTSGYRHSCAIVGDGRVYCWGANDHLQTGVAADASTNVGFDGGVGVPRPTLVPLPQPAIAVSAGFSHTCAVLTDTTVRCWGDSTFGATGRGSGGDADPPSIALETDGAVTKTLTGVRQVAAGSLHTCALFESGAVACTGYDGQLQLGFDAGVAGGVLSFQRVPGVSGATAIFSGGYHTCATTPQGLWCWGSNDEGQVGAPITDAGVASPTFTAIGGASTAAAGAHHTCAVATSPDAAVETFCVGDNAYGESLAPLSTPLLQPLALVRLDCRRVWAGYGNTCAVLLSGELQCAGYNGDGQLGAGNAGGYSALTPVKAPLSVVQVAIGSDHACAALDDGGIACWGSNTVGQLGIGLDAGELLAVPQSVPVP